LAEVGTALHGGSLRARRRTVEHLIRGVRDAVDKKSWYAAVALVLTLPDSERVRRMLRSLETIGFASYG
jgi:hypothetical protein